MLKESTKLIKSVCLVYLPSEILITEEADFASNPIAFKTEEVLFTPEEQAAPVEIPKPSISNLINKSFAFTPDNFPFEIKQNPSNLNALGLVKFMFPNRFSIYMHDTPSKELFFREERTFSHGCIRVQDPFDFAHVLLTEQMEDPITGFVGFLERNREVQINLQEPVPVHIQYRTVFRGIDGEVNYRSDIYGRDAMVFLAMSDAGFTVEL